MEPFLRKRLTFLSLWDKIWRVGVLDDCVLRTPDAEPEETESPGAEPSGPLVPPEQLFMALCDFTAWCATELSVSRGDRLFTLKEEDDYVLARRLLGQPSAGLVSRTHVTRATPDVLSDQPWYFRGISRTEAQQLLLSPTNVPGAFLIRPSESSQGDYSLSVWAQARVCHYRISRAAKGGLYLQKGRLFPILEELLIYYKTNWKLIQNPLLQSCMSQKAPEQDEWERPRAEFALRRKLGKGYFGEVWEGLWLGSVPVAIRIIKSADMKLADLTKETQTLKSLRQERLIRLHAVCSAGEPVYIVSELMRKGNLQAYLGASAAHRDLAARNVQVGDDLSCKVADFGLARLLKDNISSPSSGTKIPIRWTAPEAANYSVYTQESDVCSFGILLFKVFTYGQCPYEGTTNHETLQQISRGRLPRLATCPAEVYVLMLECWKASPEERPAFAELQEKLGAGYRRLHLAVM
ncbi:LOW QUALITY PROTEIN: tyrosine-protein kinase Srms [Trichechus inunguis]